MRFEKCIPFKYLPIILIYLVRMLSRFYILLDARVF